MRLVHWEDFGLVLVYSLGSLVWLFVLTKLMGNRQMSQLTLFDYIIGISIGSIAAEMASHPEEDAWLGLIAMTIYALVAVGFNVLNDKSLKARRVVTPQDRSLAPAQDRPAVAVVMDGVPFPERLKAVGLDEAWLQKQLKNQRIDDCRDVFFASVDRDHQLSVYLRETDGRSKDHYA